MKNLSYYLKQKTKTKTMNEEFKLSAMQFFLCISVRLQTGCWNFKGVLMEFLGGWNKEEDDEEGDGIILVFFFWRNFRFGSVLWFCAYVYCFGLVLDCAALVIQRKMGGERDDRVFIRKEKEYRGEIVIKIRIFVL